MPEQNPHEVSSEVQNDQSIEVSQQPTQPSSKSKTPLIALGLLLLAVGLAGAAYLYQQSTATPVQQLKDDDFVYVPSTSVPQENETVNWKTYTGLGFTLQYPNDWEGLDNNCEKIVIGSLPSNGLQVKEFAKSQVFPTGTVQEFNEVLESLPAALKIYLPNVSSSDYMAVGPQGAGEINTMYVRAPQGDYYHILTVFASGSIEDWSTRCSSKEADYKRILSTFKFTDSTSTVDTSTWKTYSNPTLGFSLKHPPEYISDEELTSQQVIFRAESGDVEISSFVIATSLEKFPQYLFDQEPTGKYFIDGVEGIYAELPNGYGDGLMTSPPEPLLAVAVENKGKLYKFNFGGVSSIKDPTVVQILSSFKFGQ